MPTTACCLAWGFVCFSAFKKEREMESLIESAKKRLREAIMQNFSEVSERAPRQSAAMQNALNKLSLLELDAMFTLTSYLRELRR